MSADSAVPARLPEDVRAAVETAFTSALGDHHEDIEGPLGAVINAAVDVAFDAGFARAVEALAGEAVQAAALAERYGPYSKYAAVSRVALAAAARALTEQETT